MAGRIQGITIEIDGNTTKLQNSLKGVDSQLKNTQKSLRDIDKLLKLDPGNTELLTQKQKQLQNAIKGTKERLAELKAAQAGVKEGTDEWDRLQREIIATEQDLKSLEKQQRQFGNVASQQIKAVGAAMDQYGQKVSDVGNKLMPMSTAAAGALTAMGALAYKTVQAADDLNTLAQQTGFTTEEIQKLQYASDFVDVSFEDMSGALTKVKKNMTGHEELWEKLGVSVKNADGSMRDATDVFYDSLDALSKIDNETERDQAAMELFGKSADQLAGIIDDGGKSLKEYGKQAEDLGAILDGDTVDSLNEINDVLDTLKKQAGGALAKLGATLAKTLAPALEKVGKFIGKVTDAIGKLTPKQAETILKITGIVAAIAPLLVGVGKVISIAGKVVSVIGTVVGVLGGPLTIAIAAIIGVGVLLWKNWDTIKEKANQLKDWLVATWEGIKSAVSGAVDAIKTKVSATWDSIKTTVSNTTNAIKTTAANTWNSMKSFAASSWDGIETMLAGKWANIKAAYEEHGGGLKGAASAAVQGIKEYFSLGFDTLNTLLGGKLDTIKQKFQDIMDKLKELASKAVEKIKEAFKFEWRLPHVKLPHFKVEGGKWPYGLGGEGYLPSIKIDWYKRAYENAMMFTSPTVMATPGGLKGFGDGNGAEIVLGLNKLRELVGSTSGSVTVNVYASPTQSAKEIAYEVQRVLVAQQQQRSRAYA